ncbi:MAG: 50S ribosomal protein L22 [Actinomycetota bacterium]|nr:50S ribosomal protein L22 [Actinomycetota bacterium]
MTATKTNEREGTRAVLRHSRVSPYKVRPVLDLIRGKDVQRAREALQFSERDVAQLVDKLLRSAVANAENNDGLDPEGLYVSACYADEGPTMKRWRPRARGRATRIRKRTCHVTVIVSRLPDEQLARIEARQAGDASRRARRVAGGRQGRRAARQEQEQEQSSPAGAEAASAPDEQEQGPSNADERGEPPPPQENSERGGDE